MYHTITVTIEEYTQDGFDNEAMRVLAQDIANYATKRAKELNLDTSRANAIFAREGDDESAYRYLASFDGESA